MALTAYFVFLLLVAAERAAELLLSRRNARLAFARGGVESAADHFRWMTALHALFLPACAIEAYVRALHRGHDWIVSPPDWTWADWSWSSLLFLGLALGAQGLRWWAIAALGWRWNVRVIVTPGEPPVRRGPYRFVRHPNYIAVIVEMLAVPLVHGAFLTALVFSLLNAWVLRVRIRDEERALGASYAAAFAQVPRFIPHG